MGKPLPTLEVEEIGPVFPERLLTCYVEDWVRPRLRSDPGVARRHPARHD